MSIFTLPESMPPWVRQSARALIALVLGLIVGLSSSEPKLLLIVAAVLVITYVTASLRRPDPLVFAAFAAIAIPKAYLPGSPIPLGESLMLLATFSALMTLNKGRGKVPKAARVALGALLVVYVLSSLLNGHHDFATIKRLIHMVVYVLIIVGLTRGLLSWRIAIRGMQVGLLFSVIMSIVLLPVSTYPGRLTGLFGDPNVAGLLMVVLGTICLWGIRSRRYQVVYGGILALGLVLTFSRTGLLAAMLVTAWVVLGRKLRPVAALMAVIAVTLMLSVLPTNLQSVGPFSDRTGSDQLRDRVAGQEFRLVKEKPILGHGAGTATVLVNFGTTKFFFHNSYLAVMQESGIVGLGLVIALLFGTFLALVSLETTDRQPMLEGALIGVAVVGINLGEVLVELGAAVAIGFGLAHVVSVRLRHRQLDALETVS